LTAFWVPCSKRTINFLSLGVRDNLNNESLLYCKYYGESNLTEHGQTEPEAFTYHLIKEGDYEISVQIE
jgi:SHS2 domain-containing protein